MISKAFDGALNGQENMDRDCALLDLLSDHKAAYRVYSWDGPWISLGKFQKPEKALKEGCPAPWVMRPTGGKAVLHGHDVTLGLAARLEAIGVQESRSVGPAYRQIVGPIVQAMKDGGARVELAENTRFVRTAGHTADCFAHIAPNDIVDPMTGQKICGCALKLTNDAVLVQASIPAGQPLVDPRLVFDAPHSGAICVGLEAQSFFQAMERAILSVLK